MTTPSGLSPGQLAQIACILEVTARKPGNVYPGRDFDDVHHLDFLLSAAAIVGPLDDAATTGIGPAVLAAVEATRRVVATNTNLGMILLLTPLASVPAGEPLRQGVALRLEATTIEDARAVYRAIRLARPGGLGTATSQDIEGEPTVTLLETMRLAAGRDLVARQYSHHFADVFDLAVPTLHHALELGRPLETAIIFSFLNVLARLSDTLIARKRGESEAREASRRAVEVLAAGWPDTESSHLRCRSLDDWLRAEGHSRNPGATADLICASLFVALRDGTVTLPRISGPIGWSGVGGRERTAKAPRRQE